MMKTENPPQVETRLHGAVLTCYIDGQKFFKSVRFDDPAVTAAPPAPAEVARGVDADGREHE